MNANKALALMDKYAACPSCGNQILGNGQGTLDVGDERFVRTCKCGWKVVVDENDHPWDGECG